MRHMVHQPEHHAWETASLAAAALLASLISLVGEGTAPLSGGIQLPQVGMGATVCALVLLPEMVRVWERPAQKRRPGGWTWGLGGMTAVSGALLLCPAASSQSLGLGWGWLSVLVAWMLQRGILRQKPRAGESWALVLAVACGVGCAWLAPDGLLWGAAEGLFLAGVVLCLQERRQDGFQGVFFGCLTVAAVSVPAILEAPAPTVPQLFWVLCWGMTLGAILRLFGTAARHSSLVRLALVIPAAAALGTVWQFLLGREGRMEVLLAAVLTGLGAAVPLVAELGWGWRPGDSRGDVSSAQL